MDRTGEDLAWPAPVAMDQRSAVCCVMTVAERLAVYESWVDCFDHGHYDYVPKCWDGLGGARARE